VAYNVLKIKRLQKMFFDNRICYALKEEGSQKVSNNLFKINKL